MAFHIYVHRVADREQVTAAPPEDPAEYDRWASHQDRLLLFEAPLGSGGAVYHRWSAPASRLGLPMLASL